MASDKQYAVDHACKTCFAWNKHTEGFGFCHLTPPECDGFPKTGPNDWCCQWIPDQEQFEFDDDVPLFTEEEMDGLANIDSLWEEEIGV